MRTGYLEDKLRLKDVWSRPSDRVAPTRHGGVLLHGGAQFEVVAQVPAKGELFKALCKKPFSIETAPVAGFGDTFPQHDLDSGGSK